MTILQKLKNAIIGKALAKTDDVFERAKIELLYSFVIVLSLLSVLFFINVLTHHYVWQSYITGFAVVSIPFVLVVLNRAGNVRYAGYLFVVIQMIMAMANQFMINFDLNTQSVLWTTIYLLITFFVLGKGWGWSIAGFMILVNVLALVNKLNGDFLYHFKIPPDQQVPEAPFFFIVPLILAMYGIHQIINTREVAEKQISAQKKQLLEKNKDITDSINYARRIQTSILPKEIFIHNLFADCFVLYRPKDIVSGDFYWATEKNGKKIIVAADCTGHGVPGAFMSITGITLLNEIVNEKEICSPSEILHHLRERLMQTLQQTGASDESKDGMDIAICVVDKQMLEFSGANNPLYFVRDGRLKEIKGDRQPVGVYGNELKPFSSHKIELKKGDCFYIFSDGYADQFGGPNGKKFKYKQLQEKILSVQHEPAVKQKESLNQTIEAWKKGMEQTDDMLVIGICVGN